MNPMEKVDSSQALMSLGGYGDDEAEDDAEGINNISGSDDEDITRVPSRQSEKRQASLSPEGTQPPPPKLERKGI